LREGRLSLDQVGVIAERAGEGSDEHYAALAEVATVSQLRTAIKLEPRPQPDPRPEPQRSITKTTDEQSTCWRIKLPHVDAAEVRCSLAVAPGCADRRVGARSRRRPALPKSAALAGHWRRVHAVGRGRVGRRGRPSSAWAAPPRWWVHLDLNQQVAALHLGPLLSEAERRYLLCDATCEVWFERDGQVIGSGRATRVINRRLRRALEHRHPTCAVPGCGATRGLHAHHIRHWEDGGPTELDNLVLLCPYHHRLHHRGVITITGPADRLTVTDSADRELSAGSLARPPNRPPPAVPPYRGPTGERADWWWYDPFQPQPPPTNN
jgi:hypothetical protein